MVSTIRFLIALINLAIDREKEVGEFNLKEDLLGITEYFEKVILNTLDCHRASE